MQIALPRAHINFHLQRDVLVEAQVPIVSRTAEMHGVGLLRNVELADAAVHMVIDAGLVVGVAVGKIRVENVACAAVDGELPRTHLQPGVRRLCTLQIDGLGGVMRTRIEAVAAGEAASMPKKNDQNDNKGKRSDGRTDGDSRRSVWVAASIGGI